MSELRAFSTRARITTTGFINEYEWGSFKGDVDAWVERYFDAFLYTASWGTNTLAFRLPGSLLDAKAASDYCLSEHAAVRTNNGKTILTFCSGGADVHELVNGDGLLATMVTVRAELLRGDLRALYLAWLLSAQSGVLSDDDREPPVPAGLNQLSASLESMREFLRIDVDLLAAGAAQSAPHKLEPLREGEVRQWIATLPVEEKDRLLTRLAMDDDGTLAIEVQRRYLDSRGTSASLAKKPSRTVGQLKASAKALGEKRRREVAEREEQKRVQQELEAQRSRQAYLEAVSCLVDLRDLAVRSGNVASFRQRVERLRAVNSTRARFLERLDAAEL